MNIVICTLKSWNIRMAKKFGAINKDKYNVNIISTKEELNCSNLRKLNPDYVFFPHWSYIIPEDIYNSFECIVFHMTDLPYGRGGSPLQNLIVRGMKETKISALKVVENLDEGPIYLKNSLSLLGTAEEIYIRASNIIFHEMIPKIVEYKLSPKEQCGEIVKFKRRNESEGEIKQDMSLEKIYDYIRMLDAEGYPNSFIRFGKYKLSFSRASMKEGKIIADVEIKEVLDE